jgi:phosphatidylserine/phosphatidylglycerophosphate/cardiolipin synthase-like enzyme
MLARRCWADRTISMWVIRSFIGAAKKSLFIAVQELDSRAIAAAILAAKAAKVHHKLMVIDERLVIAGSFNYTAPATTLNDENILVIGDLEESQPAAEAAQRQVAAFALAEINRIITTLSQRVWRPRRSAHGRW